MSQVRSWGKALFTCVSVLVLISSFALAQSDTASISGFVRDPSGAIIPNATVVIKNEAT